VLTLLIIILLLILWRYVIALIATIIIGLLMVVDIVLKPIVFVLHKMDELFYAIKKRLT